MGHFKLSSLIRLFVYVCLLPATLLVKKMCAQTTDSSPGYTRQEVTLGASTPTGPSLRYTYNLSPNFAVETKLSGWPSPLISGEDSMVLAAGIKGGLRRGRWNFFGTITPGWGVRPDTDIQYGSTTIGNTTYIYPTVDRPILRSHFVLQTGIGIEYSFTRRFFLRADMTEYIEPTFSRVEFNNLYSQITEPGKVSEHTAVDISAGYRFGRMRSEPDILPSHRSTIDVGALYSLHIREHLLFQDPTADSGIGGWISYNLKPWISLEATAFHSPHNDMTYNFQDGGQEFAVFAGVKSGIRRDRFGLFAKLRPGAVRFEHGLASEDFTATNFDISSHPIYQPALDAGGVVEYYPSRHFLLRAEAGDAIIFYRPKTILFNSVPDTADVRGATSSLLLLFGGGVRF